MEHDAQRSSFAKEAAKTAVVGSGAIACILGVTLGTTYAFEKMQEQVVSGLQNAARPNVHPMLEPATPMKSAETGPTINDYAGPGGIAIAELGIAGVALWKLNKRSQKVPRTVKQDACPLTDQEERTFAMIVSEFKRGD